jgi:hypothetical protein
MYCKPSLNVCQKSQQFDLWMLVGAHDVFTLVVIFLVQINSPNTSQLDCLRLLKQLGKPQYWSFRLSLTSTSLTKKNPCFYVKDEVFNLGSMTIALTSMVNCEGLGLEEIFLRACQYGTTTNEKVSFGFHKLWIKFNQTQISKNSLDGLRNLGKGTKNGPRCVRMWVCIHRKFWFLWRPSLWLCPTL